MAGLAGLVGLPGRFAGGGLVGSAYGSTGASTGAIDGYWETRLSPWDLAAGALIVMEAGGTVTDTRGGPFRAESGEVIAAGGGIHQAIVTELARVRATTEESP